MAAPSSRSQLSPQLSLEACPAQHVLCLPFPLLPSLLPLFCSLLKAREAELHSLAQALLANETLTLAEIRALLDPSSPALPSGGSGAQRQAEGDAAAVDGGSEVPAPVPAAAAAAPAVPPAA